MGFFTRTAGASVELIESDFDNEVHIAVDDVVVATFTEEGRLQLRSLDSDFECISHFLAVNEDGQIVIENEDGEVLNVPAARRLEDAEVTVQAIPGTPVYYGPFRRSTDTDDMIPF